MNEQQVKSVFEQMKELAKKHPTPTVVVLQARKHYPLPSFAQPHDVVFVDYIDALK